MRMKDSLGHCNDHVMLYNVVMNPHIDLKGGIGLADWEPFIGIEECN